MSPTPPVECLSSRGPSSPGHFSTSPLSRMASVRTICSSGFIPLNQVAIAKAAIWASDTRLPDIPSTKETISSALSGSPSRFFSISSSASCMFLLYISSVSQVLVQKCFLSICYII